MSGVPRRVPASRRARAVLAVPAVLGLLAGMAACTPNQGPAAEGDRPVVTGDASVPPSEQPPAASAGITQVGDVFGPGCGQLPPQGIGSVPDLVDQPVASGLATVPALSTLAGAVQAAQLTDTLDSAEQITVFAPVNQAFAALDQAEPGTVEELTTGPDAASPNGDLAALLTYHVVGQRMTAADLVATGTLTTVGGGQLKIGGTADAPTVNGATVLCGNIPTANATVFVLDRVLSPAPA